MFHDLLLPIIARHIQRELNLPRYEIRATVDEVVHADRGEFMINVYPSTLFGELSEDQQHGLEYSFAFTVGITQRVGKVPDDRLFKHAYSAGKGCMPVARQVITILRRDRWSLNATICRALAELPTDWRMIEPFRFQGDTAAVTKVGPRHFGVYDNVSDRQELRSSLFDSATGLFGLWIPLNYADGRMMAHLDSSGTQSGDPIVI